MAAWRNIYNRISRLFLVHIPTPSEGELRQLWINVMLAPSNYP
jgi:hypothetical protein